MADKKKREIKESQNVLAESSIKAGKNVHIGDIVNNNYVNEKKGESSDDSISSKNKKSGKWKFLEITFVKLILFSVTLLGITVSIDKCNFIEIGGESPANSKMELSIENDTTSFNSENSLLNLHIKKESDQPNNSIDNPSVKKANQKPISKLIFTNSADEIEQVASNTIFIQAQKYGLNLIEAGQDIKFNREFRCKITIQKEKVEIGIRPTLKIIFYLEAAYLNLPDRELLFTYYGESKEYFIYKEKEIPVVFKKWIVGMNGKFLPQEM